MELIENNLNLHRLIHLGIDENYNRIVLKLDFELQYNKFYLFLLHIEYLL